MHITDIFVLSIISEHNMWCKG